LKDEETKTNVIVKARAEAEVGPTTFVLEVTQGPGRGERYVIDESNPGRQLVGTGPACALRLVDPSVSRRHAAFELAGFRLRVTDLGSTNGTYVDRVKVVEAELEGEEIVRLGSTALRVERRDGGPVPPVSDGFGRLVGGSVAMRRLYPLCERLAATPVPVVIEGETGTGKEVLAESLHEAGPRRNGPFVVFDCTAVPPNLVETELFGHERGAFTGAVAQRKGVFEQTDGGTLFIDEIGDLDPLLQPKLLRALERSEIRRVGGDKWIKADVRVIAATRRDLDREVEEGRFRDDLFHRLAVARVELPPLRNREGDVVLLAKHIWRGLGGTTDGLDQTVLDRWSAQEWPGNVRELRNAVTRHFALGDLQIDRQRSVERELAKAAKADTVDRLLAMHLPYSEARDRLMDEFERRFVEKLLAEHDGDVARAAAASGIGTRYFQKLRARRRQ
jgi:DNA-binding NtrC family response regulator